MRGGLFFVEVPSYGSLHQVSPLVIAHGSLTVRSFSNVQLSSLVNDAILFQDTQGCLPRREVDKTP